MRAMLDSDTRAKPTVNDIARVAGVSLATVDRVLNERPGVRAVTIEKVARAIEELGYVRDTAAANLARRKQYRLLFLLPNSDNEFIVALEQAIVDQAPQHRHDRTVIEPRGFSQFDPRAICEALDSLDAGETDGVAVFGLETPSVRDAVKRARARGIAVVALVSDLPSSERDHFVGIDNIAAGRTAAQLMGRFVNGRGRVLVITGSRLARDHLERRSGFDAVMHAEFPDLDIVASIEGRDDPELILKLLPDVFENYPDLKGIYSSAAGNRGLIEYLQASGRTHDLVVIAHELTPLSRAALKNGVFDAVINQDAGHLVRSAARLLRATRDASPYSEEQERIRIDIYLKENMPGSVSG